LLQIIQCFDAVLLIGGRGSRQKKNSLKHALLSRGQLANAGTPNS